MLIGIDDFTTSNNNLYVTENESLKNYENNKSIKSFKFELKWGNTHILK